MLGSFGGVLCLCFIGHCFLCREDVYAICQGHAYPCKGTNIDSRFTQRRNSQYTKIAPFPLDNVLIAVCHEVISLIKAGALRQVGQAMQA